MRDQVGEVFALQVLLDQVRPDRVEPEVEGADDRGMIEVAGDLRFTEELLAELGVVRQAHLDRDEPLEERVATAVQGRESAVGDPLENVVLPDPLEIGDDQPGLLRHSRKILPCFDKSEQSGGAR